MSAARFSARAVVQHHRRGLGLDDLVEGAVRVPGAVDLIGGIPQGGVIRIILQCLLHGFLDLRVQRQIDVVAAGAQLRFHFAAVLGRILQAVEG